MGGLRSASSIHHGKVVATTPPQVRTIFWNGASRGEQFIFPHTLFVAYYTRNEGGHNIKYWLNRLHVAFSLAPIDLKNWEQPIYGLPLANTDAAGGICLYEWPGKQDPLEFIRAAISLYWVSPFNDYGDGFSHWLNVYQATSNALARNGLFREHWKQATARRDWQWLWNQHLHQAPQAINLRQLFKGNRTLTEDVEWFPNLGVSIPKEAIANLAEEKWRNAGSPDGNDERFWLEAERELDEQLHVYKQEQPK